MYVAFPAWGPEQSVTHRVSFSLEYWDLLFLLTHHRKQAEGSVQFFASLPLPSSHLQSWRIAQEQALI